MDERMHRKFLRRQLGKPGWTLLVYYLIMNVAVLLVNVVDVTLKAMALITEVGQEEFFEAVPNLMLDSAMNNGWGYFLAAGIGFLILLLWKGRKFCFGEIWKSEKAMSAWNFISLLCIFVCGQLIFQIVASILEAFLNLFGLSAMGAIESASFQTDSFSMFLYAGILAPITEEILFRGLILRTMQPYGKRFAIFTSAFLFGLFHGNVVQTPFAFVVGLVLGYTAVEYSITWAMVLHMFNNLILSDVLNRLVSQFPEKAADAISWGVILALSLAGVIIAVLRRREIGDYLQNKKIGKGRLKYFFAAPGNIVLMAVMGVMMILGITAI